MTRYHRKMIAKTAESLVCPFHTIQFSPLGFLPLWWFVPKTFQGLHFLFSGPLRWSIYIWAICPWNKFDEKAQCEFGLHYFSSVTLLIIVIWRFFSHCFQLVTHERDMLKKDCKKISMERDGALKHLSLTTGKIFFLMFVSYMYK